MKKRWSLSLARYRTTQKTDEDEGRRRVEHDDKQILQTFELARVRISSPFSISNPEDRVFFLERTFMCLVEGDTFIFD
jgi:hypothetical protein